jgi:hypothetical protein
VVGRSIRLATLLAVVWTIAAAEMVRAQIPQTRDDAWLFAPAEQTRRLPRLRWPRKTRTEAPPTGDNDPTFNAEPEAVVRTRREPQLQTRNQLLQRQNSAAATRSASPVEAPPRTKPPVEESSGQPSGPASLIDVTAFDGTPRAQTKRPATIADREVEPSSGSSKRDAAPPAAEDPSPVEKPHSLIDVTAFDGTPRQPTERPAAPSTVQTKPSVKTPKKIVRPVQATAETKAAALPPLEIDPPFINELPPILQTSHDVAPSDAKQIARPMFNTLLQDSAEPMPIVGANFEMPEIDMRGAGRAIADTFSHEEECEECWDNPWKRLFGLGIHRVSGDIGIGQERVALAGYEIDASQPFTNVRLRYDSVYGLPFPDRSLWFWAKSGNGPTILPGEVVNYQDLRLYSEVGTKLVSAIVEYPLRSLDPEFNSNTTGFGDMVVGNKAVIVDGRYWQITQVFRTYINTGSVKKGLGDGHVSLEPGVLGRYKWTDDTYLHGQIKFWFPVGADPNFGGQILKTGIGLTTLGYETDTFAVLHSTELVFYNFVGGRKTVLPGVSRSVDGEVCGTWFYGPRFVLGPAGDLGLFEVGVNGGVGFGDDWIDGMFRFELRWSY